MPAPLEQEEIDEIIETYAELGDYEETAEETDRAESTVRNYVDDAIQDRDERLEEYWPDEPEDDDDVWMGAGAGESPFERPGAPNDVPDLTDKSPGEFLRWFFEDFEVGITSKWVELQAKRADRHGRPPSMEALRDDLLGMKSGVNKSSFREADYIAQEYWAVAKEYLNQTGLRPAGQSMTQEHRAQQGYDRRSRDMGRGSQRDPYYQDRMDGPPPQDTDMMEMFRMMLQQQQQQMQELKQVIQGQQAQQNEPETVQRELQKYKQLKQLVDEMSGQGSEQISEVLEQHMVQLQNAIAQQGQQQPMPMGDSLEDKLLALASDNPNVSLQEVLGILEQREGTINNPQIKEKQLEKDMKEMELEHEEKRMERLGGTLEDLVDRFGSEFGKAVVSGGEQPATEQPRQQDASADGGAVNQTARDPPQPQEPEADPCPHCETPMERGEAGTSCPNCNYGWGQCGTCGDPVEVPPWGEADFAYCPECSTPRERPDDLDKTVTCGECDWSGPAGDLEGEALMCEGCKSMETIIRPEQQEEMMRLLAGGRADGR